jgi:hypothetical protein
MHICIYIHTGDEGGVVDEVDVVEGGWDDAFFADMLADERAHVQHTSSAYVDDASFADMLADEGAKQHSPQTVTAPPPAHFGASHTPKAGLVRGDELAGDVGVCGWDDAFFADMLSHEQGALSMQPYATGVCGFRY